MALRSCHPDLVAAAKLVRYRLLQETGAAMAAMGDIDTVVFSGRDAPLGDQLGPWLVRQLACGGNTPRQPRTWSVCRLSLPRIVADIAAGLLRSCT